MDIVWGRVIPANSRPIWLATGQRIAFEDNDGAYGRDTSVEFYVDNPNSGIKWDSIKWFALPADHFAYAALDAGFEPWGGGNSAPANWDGGEVLLRNGRRWTGYCTWYHEHASHSDIIGYRKKVEAPARAVNWTKPIEAVRKSDGFVVPVTLDSGPNGCGIYTTNECPDDEVTNRSWKVDGADCCYRNEWFVRNRADLAAPISPMTEHEARGRAAAAGARDFAAVNHYVQAIRDLDLIREETAAERFARETGHEVTPAVEAALAWKEAA